MTNESDNKSRQMQCHSSFPQEIIEMIVDNFDHKRDKETLSNLCKVSSSWETAASKTLYTTISADDLDEIVKRPYLENDVKELDFSEAWCNYCYKLKNIQFPNLTKVSFSHLQVCDNVQQFLCQNTCIQHVDMSRMSNKASIGILRTLVKTRMQVPNYQPLLSYHGLLNEEIANCLHELGTRSIYIHAINSNGIVPSFSKFSDLQDISLTISKYEEDSLIEALRYLIKFKSLSSFQIIKISSGKCSQNVSNTLVSNVLKPNAPTLQTIKIRDMSGLLKFPLNQHWPKLKELKICSSNVCPMSLIKFCEKAPNIQDIIIGIDKESLLQSKIDLPIKIINSLQKLFHMEINVDCRPWFGYYWYVSDCAEIRYIQSQRVDEKLCVEHGEPKTKLLELKEQYKNKFI